MRSALGALGVERLVLGIHDASFPAAPGEETGRGAPSSRGALGFLRFASELGFDTIQLGPQGLTSRGNPSPYDGALFSREVLSIDLCALATPEWGRLLAPEALARLQASLAPTAAERVPHSEVFDAYRGLLGAAWRAFGRLGKGSGNGASASPAELRTRFASFRRAHGEQLESDGLFEALAMAQGSEDWRRWPEEVGRELWCRPDSAQAQERWRELAKRHGDELDLFAFGQWLAHEQHGLLRSAARGLGLELFGDLQVGLSPRDRWRHQGLFLEGYLLGAPPSRTNPEGQPWGYPVLDPRLYGVNGGSPGRGEACASGPVAAFFVSRLERAFGELDGLRLDHPQGLVCPWVYRSDEPDPLQAVQRGARLFSSPDLADHPALARFAIARPDQLAGAGPRWGDAWERELEAEQLARHGVLVDLILAVARRHGRGPDHLVCEVLSTLPFPLARVLERHQLGRLRVTPKADPGRPKDPYRSEHAAPGDWIVLGNHDTEPLASVVASWVGSGEVPARAAYLASRLAEPGPRRVALRRSLEEEPRRLTHALLADALASPAGRVSLFFTDLLGTRKRYNRPGTVSEENWSLRVAPDYRESYARSRAAGGALDLPGAAAMALRARFGPDGGPHAGLLGRLDQLAALGRT